MKNFLWTDEDTQILIAMHDAGHSHAEIGRAVNRSAPSCKEKWRWIRRSGEIMEARRERTNGTRREKRHVKSPELNRVVIKQVVPDHLFIDRERRLSAQRTITGFLCGDPPPGFSALDRKIGGSLALSHG